MKENCLCIRNYINTDKSSAGYKAARDALVSEIDDPGVLDRSSILSDSSPLKKESQIIIDAFEAVTNGMENPGVIEAMDRIEDDSPLVSWKYAALAIDAFYNRNFGKMTEYLDMVEEISPVKKIEPVLLHMSGIKTMDNPGRHYLKFIDRVMRDRSLIKDAAEQIRNALEADADDLFSDTVLLVVRELKKKQPEEAERLALWSIKEAALREFSQSYFLKGYKLIFGTAEALRLFAIALKDTEKDIAVLFWLQSLIAGLRKNAVSISEASAYISITASELGKAETVDEDFIAAMNSLTSKLKQDLTLHFPALEIPEEEDNPFLFLEKLNSAMSGKKEKMDIEVKLAESRVSRKAPVQLSLFSNE